jgi:hypothetical protein
VLGPGTGPDPLPPPLGKIFFTMGPSDRMSSTPTSVPGTKKGDQKCEKKSNLRYVRSAPPPHPVPGALPTSPMGPPRDRVRGVGRPILKF